MPGGACWEGDPCGSGACRLYGGQVWGLLGIPLLSTGSIPAFSAPVAPAHVQGACGDEESLWATTDPVADAGRNQEPEVPICAWDRFGTVKTTVPGVAEAEVAVTWHIAWLSWGQGGLPGRHGLHSCTDWWAQCPALSLRCL